MNNEHEIKVGDTVRIKDTDIEDVVVDIHDNNVFLKNNGCRNVKSCEFVEMLLAQFKLIGKTLTAEDKPVMLDDIDKSEADSNQKIELFKRLIIQDDMSVYDELFPDAKEGAKEEYEEFIKRTNNVKTIEGLYWWGIKIILSRMGTNGFTPINTECSKDPIFRELLDAATKGDKNVVDKLNEYLTSKGI